MDGVARPDSTSVSGTVEQSLYILSDDPVSSQYIAVCYVQPLLSSPRSAQAILTSAPSTASSVPTAPTYLTLLPLALPRYKGGWVSGRAGCCLQIFEKAARRPPAVNQNTKLSHHTPKRTTVGGPPESSATCRLRCGSGQHPLRQPSRSVDAPSKRFRTTDQIDISGVSSTKEHRRRRPHVAAGG